MTTQIIQHNLFLDSKQADILSSDGSTATFFFNGSIELNKQDLFLSLLSCNIVFNEPNVKDGVNNIFYWTDKDDVDHSYQFESGLYSMQEINDEISQLMIDQHGNDCAYQFQFTPDTSTGKCRVQFRNVTNWALDPTKTMNILSILGFPSDQGIITATAFN